MQRREFIAVLGSAAVWPLAARAQQTVPVIGYVSGRSLEYEERLLLSFRKGLEEEGFAAGRNVAVQYRFSDGDDSRLPAIAADFVRRQVAVIVASGPSAVAVKGATSTIPIVFSTGADPVGQGWSPASAVPAATQPASPGHGLLYERRRHHAVAAVPHDDMDRTVGCISTRSNCQVQAALTDTLVPLRFRVHSRGLAPHRAGDDPCTSCPFTDRIARIARGPATAAKGRRAGTPRGKQRAIVSKLDSGAPARVARRDRSPPLCL